jgi:hypothetical protein
VVCFVEEEEAVLVVRMCWKKRGVVGLVEKEEAVLLVWVGREE